MVSASSAAALICTTASLAKGGWGPREAVNFPMTVLLSPLPWDLLSAAPLHSSFPEDSPKTLCSSIPELLTLSPLFLYLADHFLTVFCYWLFVLRWFGFFGKFNSVLNQSRNGLFLFLEPGMTRRTAERHSGNWNRNKYFFTSWDFYEIYFSRAFFFFFPSTCGL